MIAEELVERGYRAIVVHNGREGLAAIIKEMPDLVLCDISMRDMSGFEVLSDLIKIAPGFAHMPFVFLTGLTDRASKLRGRHLGADDYVIKPIDFDVLGTIIIERLANVARTGVSTRELQLDNREVEIPPTWIAARAPM